MMSRRDSLGARGGLGERKEAAQASPEVGERAVVAIGERSLGHGVWVRARWLEIR